MFKQNMQISFYQYVIQQRLRRAALAWHAHGQQRTDRVALQRQGLRRALDLKLQEHAA